MPKQPKRSSLSKIRGDTFTDAWGASTKWKSSIHRDVGHAISGYSDNRPVPLAPRVKVASKSSTARDKPLPPVPTDVPPESSEDPNITENQGTAILSLSSSYNSNPLGFCGLRRRRAFFNKSAKQKPKLTVQGPLQVAELVDGQIHHDLIASKIDKGTQTSPSLQPVGRPDRQRETPKQMSSAEVAQPRSLKQLTEMESTPSISPKGVWMKMAPQDYFSVPPRAERVLPSTTTTSSSTDVSLKKKDHDSGDKGSVRRTSGSGDTIGTYESRYSARAGENSNDGLRPEVPRTSASDSCLADSGHRLTTSSASEHTDRRPESKNRPASADSLESSRRIRPMPFLRMSTLSGSRIRGKRGSSSEVAGPVSPLRQELKLSELPEPIFSDAQPPSPSFFRIPMMTPEGQAEFLAFVPDHLEGSPLCPRSPKHASRGTGFCNLHGRNDALLSYSSADTAAASLAKRNVQGRPQLTISGSVSSETSSRTSSDTMSEASPNVMLGMAGHAANSPDCPAHAGQRAVCVYHGRSKLTTNPRSQ